MRLTMQSEAINVKASFQGYTSEMSNCKPMTLVFRSTSQPLCKKTTEQLKTHRYVQHLCRVKYFGNKLWFTYVVTAIPQLFLCREFPSA